MKKLLCFEGLSGVGKSKSIQILKNLISHKYSLQVFDKNHPDVSILHNAEELLNFKHSYSSKLSFRTTRMYLALNFAATRNYEINILDRGLLTFFINAQIENIDKNIIDQFLTDFKQRLKQFNYATVFLSGTVEKVNLNLARYRINAEKRIAENYKFLPFLQDLSNYDFLGKVIQMDADLNLENEIEKVLDFIDQ